VGHRAGLDVVPGIEPWSFSPLFIHYTDWATAVLKNLTRVSCIIVITLDW
jgi:hypothetical protein